MGRIYAVTFEGTAVTAQVDFFELAPADDKPVRLLGLMLSQSSDLGDAAEEILRLKVIRGHATSGSGGSSATPRPVNTNDAAAGSTAETLNTTIASTGTAVDLLADTFNIRSGYQLWWTPETAPMASQADGTIVVRLMAAPADSLTMSGTLYFEEMP
jgi:hypothetical protein